MTINPMIDRNPAKSLERAYNEAGEFQIYREIYMNSLEAGASKAGVSNFYNKLAWLDDGCGIDPSDLDQLINGRNSSSKNTDGRHGNFGVGLKDAGLFPNPHGLIVVSKTESHPKGGMIWLCIDPELGAGAKMLISDEMRAAGNTGDGQAVIDFQNHDSFTIDGIDFMSVFSESRSFKDVNTGTAIILMGQDKADVTFPNLGKVRQYLQSRIYEFNLGVYGFRERGGNSTILKGVNKGHSAHIISSMIVNGFTVETSIYHGDRISKQAGDDPAARQSFLEATLYQDEMYGVSFTSSRASQMKRSRDTALKYGLIYPQVYNRVNIVIKPPIYDEATGVGCFPDSSRSTLRWEDPDSQDRQSGIPYEMIQEHYRENMPEELRQMMNEIAKTETRHEQRTQTARLSRFFSKNRKSRLKLSGDGYTLVTSSSGDEDGGCAGPLFNPPKSNPSEAEGVNATPKKRKVKAKKKNDPIEPDTKKKKARRKAGTVDPLVIFSDEDPTGSAREALNAGNDLWYPYFYEEQTNRLYINHDSVIMKEDLIPACIGFLQSRKSTYTIPLSIEQVYTYVIKPSLREALPTTITHARASTHLHNLGVHPRNPQHIALMCSGLWQFERFYQKHYKQFKLRAQAQVVH